MQLVVFALNVLLGNSCFRADLDIPKVPHRFLYYNEVYLFAFGTKQKFSYGHRGPRVSLSYNGNLRS